jgi:hypothetical protein
LQVGQSAQDNDRHFAEAQLARARDTWWPKDSRQRLGLKLTVRLLTSKSVFPKAALATRRIFHFKGVSVRAKFLSARNVHYGISAPA